MAREEDNRLERDVYSIAGIYWYIFLYDIQRFKGKILTVNMPIGR